MLGVFVLSSRCGAGQAPPAGNLPPVMIASLPDAPMLSDVDTARSGNGAPEYSNATPQVKQSIEDQSDDQENPAFFKDHLIRDRFWVSGQSNFIDRKSVV